MPTNENSVVGGLARLPILTKIAAVLFIVAKLHGLLGAVMMFVNRPVSGVLLIVAGASLLGSIVLALLQLSRAGNPRRLADKLEWHRAEAERLEAMLKA